MLKFLHALFYNKYLQIDFGPYACVIKCSLTWALFPEIVRMKWGRPLPPSAAAPTLDIRKYYKCGDELVYGTFLDYTIMVSTQLHDNTEWHQ